MKKAVDEKMAAESSSAASHDKPYNNTSVKKDIKTIKSSNPTIKFVEESPEPVRRQLNAAEKKLEKTVYIPEENAAEFCEIVADMAEEHTPLKAQDAKVLAANLHHVNESMARLHRAQGYTLGMMEKAQKVNTQKLAMVGPFDYNLRNEEERENMVGIFCENLGLARRDVRDVQARSFGKL